MNKTDYKKIEYYLYNYSNIDKLIDEIKAVQLGYKKKC